jgi:hypothetical protein
MFICLFVYLFICLFVHLFIYCLVCLFCHYLTMVPDFYGRSGNSGGPTVISTSRLGPDRKGQFVLRDGKGVSLTPQMALISQGLFTCEPCFSPNVKRRIRERSLPLLCSKPPAEYYYVIRASGVGEQYYAEKK